MQRTIINGTLLVSLAFGGCATKHYGRLTDISDVEKQDYTCREIVIEQSKVASFQDQIRRGARIDWRSAAGFLGDFGIGNAMERSDAEKSAEKRQDQLRHLSDEKHCSDQPQAGWLQRSVEAVGSALGM